MSGDAHWDAKNGNVDALKVKMAEPGFDINDINQTGRSYLHDAADFGQVEVVRLLCSKGANVNLQDKYGVTPLLSAISESHKDCVKVLLEKGATRMDPDGKPYLEVAEDDDIKDMLK